MKSTRKKLSELTTDTRNAIPKGEFALPADRKYPIHDLSHARNALARSSGKPEEAKVKAAVYKKYPALKQLSEFEPLRALPFDFQLAEGDGVPDKVQVLKIGTFKHAQYGDFSITRDDLKQLKENFDSKVRKVDLAVDYFHKTDEEAAGWFTELFLTEGGSELWAKVEWTSKASKMLADKEVRYFSADFASAYTDAETGKKFKNVLLGGGLTNRPFIKGMDPIVQLQEKGNEMKTVAELTAEMKTLNETLAAEKTKSEDLAKQLSEAKAIPPGKKAADPANPEGDDEAADTDLAAKIEELQKQIDALSADNKKMSADKEMAEKKASFDKMLSEGRACEAQRKPYMDSDFKQFAEKAGKVNMLPKGSGGGTEGGAGEDAADTVMKLAEEKRKADPKISHGDAISRVLMENPALREQVEA